MFSNESMPLKISSSEEAVVFGRFQMFPASAKIAPLILLIILNRYSKDDSNFKFPILNSKPVLELPGPIHRFPKL